MADSSCVEEISSSTSESFSTTNKLCSPPTAAPLRLHRMGSGVSSISIETEPRKLPSSKYKGVVPQPNGRWGAQIYEKHQRVWLGTFNEQEEAARSYDIAARRFRGRDAIVNFKSIVQDSELAFLEAHSKSEIVDMLRKHTYGEELEQNNKRRLFLSDGKSNGTIQNDDVLKTREVLFEKAVTPSDVGKLNRLVIPKQHAEKHFPLPSPSTKGVLINFEDVNGKVWRFRYSYWNSSQSYVLTKGWSRFVKEKKLRAGDVVTFERSTGLDRQLFIDCNVRSGLRENPVQVVVRLFGVDIFNVTTTVKPNDVVDDCGGKRSRDVDDMFALRCSKKQTIINAL